MKLKCPYCDNILTSGQAKIHGTFAGFLLYGLSHQNLYFKSESEEEIKILGSNKSTPAMRCDNCGIVTLNLNYSEQQEKDNLIDILTLCSSKELRDSIQKSNPNVDVKAEIIKNWKKNYLPNNNDFKKLFTTDELTLLEDFNQLIDDKDWDKIDNLSGEIIDKLIG